MADELKPYMLIIRNNPPQSLLSSVNLIEQWKNELKERVKSNEWWKPIEFKDEDSNVVCAYHHADIIGIIQGTVMVPEVKQSR